ncbi:MAG: hypothetical protein ABII09_05515 [Planctomycetota bacterium]
MLSRKQITYLVLGIIITISCNLSAKPIKCFVPSKPWAVTIDLGDFEPAEFLGPKTILGGNTKDGLNLTIIIEITKPGTNPVEMRKLYGYRYALGAGQKETIEEIDLNDIAVITYKWATPALPDVNKAVQNRVKEWSENTWGFNGYIVKDDVAFDIHLSADMNKHTKAQMLDIIKSFQIAPSTEQEEFLKLRNTLASSLTDQEKVKFANDFAQKYPANPDIQFMLGEHYFAKKNHQKARMSYLQALDNHKIQPITNPQVMLLCYDGLGMCGGILKEYELAEKYLKAGYDLAKTIEEREYIGLLAYNLACLYAETGKLEESVKYLSEAITINRECKEEAKQDSSFDKIRDDIRFKNLVGK